MKKVTLIGTGLMGYPMANNILKNGYALSVFNRTKAKAEGLSRNGAIISSSIKDALENSDVIITMLPDDNTVTKVINSKDFLENIKTNSTVIDMSSTKPVTSKKIFDILKNKNIDFLDAPVSGGTVGAEKASLAIMVGGDEIVFNKVVNILNTMGNATLVGPIGSGQIAKLANQIIVGITIGAVAEAIHLCKISGTNPNKFIKAVEGGLADSNILKLHVKKMINQNFNPGGKTSTQLKDMNNILESAEQYKFKLPIEESKRL